MLASMPDSLPRTIAEASRVIEALGRRLGGARKRFHVSVRLRNTHRKEVA